jgi:hypothetical protein
MSFSSGAEYVDSEFTEARRDAYKDQLKAYDGIDQFDYKAGLS